MNGCSFFIIHTSFFIAMSVLLRAWQLSDAPALALLANDLRIWNNVRDYFPHPYSTSDAEAFINTNLGKTPVRNFAIEAGGQLAGGMGLILHEDVYRINAETGYWVGAPFAGKGIATDALQQLVQYAFHTFDIVKLHARVFSFNTASMRVLAKCGFVQEAVHQKAVIKNGQLYDEHWWVIFREAVVKEVV
jgi:RimJ/RimL family protein N-acetyltransferase